MYKWVLPPDETRTDGEARVNSSGKCRHEGVASSGRRDVARPGWLLCRKGSVASRGAGLRWIRDGI